MVWLELIDGLLITVTSGLIGLDSVDTRYITYYDMESAVKDEEHGWWVYSAVDEEGASRVMKYIVGRIKECPNGCVITQDEMEKAEMP